MSKPDLCHMFSLTKNLKSESRAIFNIRNTLNERYRSTNGKL